jgi:hypothetical protein
VLEDALGVNGPAHQRADVLVVNRLVDAVELLVGDVAQARRKLQTKQVEQREHDVRVAGRIGRVRAGDVWLRQSRRYADPASYLIPTDRWPELRPEVCKLVNTAADGSVRLPLVELPELLLEVDGWTGFSRAPRLRSRQLAALRRRQGWPA